MRATGFDFRTWCIESHRLRFVDFTPCAMNALLARITALTAPPPARVQAPVLPEVDIAGATRFATITLASAVSHFTTNQLPIKCTNVYLYATVLQLLDPTMLTSRGACANPKSPIKGNSLLHITFKTLTFSSRHNDTSPAQRPASYSTVPAVPKPNYGTPFTR